MLTCTSGVPVPVPPMASVPTASAPNGTALELNFHDDEASAATKTPPWCSAEVAPVRWSSHLWNQASNRWSNEHFLNHYGCTIQICCRSFLRLLGYLCKKAKFDLNRACPLYPKSNKIESWSWCRPQQFYFQSVFKKLMMIDFDIVTLSGLRNAFPRTWENQVKPNII